jgi:hypothetical protein
MKPGSWPEISRKRVSAMHSSTFWRSLAVPVGVSVGGQISSPGRFGIQRLEPPTGIEPVTCCLQNSCSAN